MCSERRRVLITVKTYPNPSAVYDETVCTAGIDLDTGRFIRLHPVRFRHLDYDRWFRKYDVLDVEVSRKKGDARQDTYTPVVESMRKIGHIGTGSGRPPDWAERNEIVLPLVKNLDDLLEAASGKECSLGVVPMLDPVFTAEEDDSDWTEKQLNVLNREQLFGRKLTPLEKVPWKFHYSFRCSEEGKPHRLQFLDWEAYQLYRNQRAEHGPEKAIRDVLDKYQVAYGPERRALYLFVGTHYRWQEEFMGIGLYFPPRVDLP